MWFIWAVDHKVHNESTPNANQFHKAFLLKRQALLGTFLLLFPYCPLYTHYV